MVRVARVLPGSIAEELEIAPGTELRSVNGRALGDFLDWEFLSAESDLVLEGRDAAGEETVWEIERDESRSLGIELDPPTIRRCANRCEFCFIEGLPAGLRKSLYVRDDDYRLSFAYGNFATLSNLKERDYERILEYRLSPLYISVHATNHEARKKLLNNERVPAIVQQLERLAGGGIEFHCQMVIVPGLNDRDVLQESLRDLWSLGDSVLTAAVVPVGLTQFSHLYTGDSMNALAAGELLDEIEPWRQRGRTSRGHAWVYGSDELYLLAGRALPGADQYPDFPQIENGVGAVTYLRDRVGAGLARIPRTPGRRIAVITGQAMQSIMPELLDAIAGATGAQLKMVALENSLFGRTTNVAGLLPGADIQRALAGLRDFDLALIPAETINDSGVFLDDMSFAEVAAQSPLPVHPSYDFLDVLAPGDGEPLRFAGWSSR
jgi:putative radical SAM enzyme (TIGR03279 family)